MKSNNKITPYEQWGKFIDSANIGSILVVLNEDNNEGKHPVWLIARPTGCERIEISVPFTNRDNAKLFMAQLNASKADDLIQPEIEWLTRELLL